MVLSCCFKETSIRFTHFLFPPPIFLSSTLESSRRKVRQHPSAWRSGLRWVWDDSGCSCGGRHGNTHLRGVVLQGWKLGATSILPQTQSPNAQEPPELSKSSWLLSAEQKKKKKIGINIPRVILWWPLFELSSLSLLDLVRWSWAAHPRQRMTRPGGKSQRRSRESSERRCCCCRRREPWRASRPRNSSALVSHRSASPPPSQSLYLTSTVIGVVTDVWHVILWIVKYQKYHF